MKPYDNLELKPRQPPTRLSSSVMKQALMMHDVGAPGERDLLALAGLMMQRTAKMAETEADAASAVIVQLLPTLAR